MIRNILYILLMIAGFITLTSKSCESDAYNDHEAKLKAKQDSAMKELRNGFESEYLLEDGLMAYGEKAKQKLLDFADYVSLYSGKNIDTLFKEQVRTMIYRLFYSQDAILQLPVVPTNRIGYIKNNLSGLLCSIDSSRYRQLEFEISGLKTIEPLHLDSDKRYSGTIGCQMRISGITGNDTTLVCEKSTEARIIVIQKNKQFGNDRSLLIWQVFLYRINAVN